MTTLCDEIEAGIATSFNCFRQCHFHRNEADTVYMCFNGTGIWGGETTRSLQRLTNEQRSHTG